VFERMARIIEARRDGDLYSIDGGIESSVDRVKM
jgi:hypothetical protein